MKPEKLRAIPRRPFSEVEWEDLLVRLEVMPKALKVLLEDVRPRDESLHELLSDLIMEESFVSGLLERAAGVPGRTGEIVQVAPSLEDGVERFVRLRARNFAMVQRRGINVWEWEVDVAEAGPTTVHQLLVALARHDVETLTAIRGFSRTESGAC